MLADFVFDGSVGIRFDGRHYDLHSFFSVSGITVCPATGDVSVDLISIDEFRNNVHGAESLRLIFSDVNYVEFSPEFCKTRSDTIEEIGFKSPEDRDDNWLKTLDQAEHLDHLFIRFSSLEFIRLACATARVAIVQSSSRAD